MCLAIDAPNRSSSASPGSVVAPGRRSALVPWKNGPGVVDHARRRRWIAKQTVESFHEDRDPAAPLRRPRIAGQHVKDDRRGSLGGGGDHVLRDYRVIAPLPTRPPGRHGLPRPGCGAPASPWPTDGGMPPRRHRPLPALRAGLLRSERPWQPGGHRSRRSVAGVNGVLHRRRLARLPEPPPGEDHRDRPSGRAPVQVRRTPRHTRQSRATRPSSTRNHPSESASPRVSHNAAGIPRPRRGRRRRSGRTRGAVAAFPTPSSVSPALPGAR